jgi:membrane associated rhomboid family serine protease
MSSKIDDFLFSLREVRGVSFIVVVTLSIYLLQNLAPVSSTINSLFALQPDLVIVGQVWKLLTYAFLHGSLWHIAFNMLALWMFGADIEYRWGRARFLRFYFFSAIFSGLFSLLDLFSSTPVSIIGASGAIFSLLVIYAFYNPHREILLFFIFPVPVGVAVALFTLISIFGLIGNGGGVAHITHLGGVAAGFLYWYKGELFEMWLDKKLKKSEPISTKIYNFTPNKEKISDEEKLKLQLDEVLKKISANGMSSLSKSDRKVLETASGKKLN